jgi:cytochrome c
MPEAVRPLLFVLPLLLCQSVAAGTWEPAGTAPRLGQPAQRTPARAAFIYPDGEGLPAGRGLAADGAALYQAHCAACHGRHAEGATAPDLVGGAGPLSSPDADKTVLTYWPYATTLFDTIRRSMPPSAPGSLSDTEIYALCAWLLSENHLWPAGLALDSKGLAAVRMPNRDGFVTAPIPAEPGPSRPEAAGLAPDATPQRGSP